MIAALQPAYLPWLGFFELVERCELFIIHDELEYSRHSWRNRNKIKTPQGWSWLVVPVRYRENSSARICEIRVDNSVNWRHQHWKTIQANYSRAPYFREYGDGLKAVYEREWEYLARLDIELTRHLLSLLGINTEIVVASEHRLEERFRDACPKGDATDRLLFLCKEFGADKFYNGKTGERLYDKDVVGAAGIELIIQEYEHPVYTQLFGEFIPYMSVIDLIFNEGARAREVILRGGNEKAGKK